jgi:predicted phage-related endonuclease
VRAYQIIDVPQRSDAWLAARCGRLGASDAASMLATVRSGEAAARRDLRVKLAIERLVGQPLENGYVNADMERGIALEADARAAYEAKTGDLVREVGYLSHTDLLAGCSPDGVLGDMEALIEIKSPRAANHYQYLKDGVVPPGYIPQVTHLLWLSGAAHCDFVSFCPQFPAPLHLFVVRHQRDEKAIAAYALAAGLFLHEVETEYEGMAAMRATMAAG